MKFLYKILPVFLMGVVSTSCVDEELIENNNKDLPEFNIEEFSDGYSLAFDVNLDPMGGSSTRSADDFQIQEWENHLDPEEFRVLFFDKDDNFLFESRTRWFTQVAAQNGAKRWRVGIPLFQYLSDNYDENNSVFTNWEMDDAYNWERIIEIMKKQEFKIAILANRPSEINVPNLSDLKPEQKKVKSFGKNGPFWGPKNSIASYDHPEDSKDIKTVFDLHHCQYDPFYENKNSGGAYDYIIAYDDAEMDDGTVKSVPFMGAVSSWLHSKREKLTTGGNSSQRYYYKLPQGQILEKEVPLEKDIVPDKDQYIPMYGIQIFAPLSTWTKGTTYNLSEQVGSQTGEFNYKNIYLLRSVVKLELRIPKYDKDGNEVKVNNQWAQICANNFAARCEPMDVWTPTEKIWEEDHVNKCEWLAIRNYGLYGDNASSDYKKKLSWFYGAWYQDDKWELGKGELEPEHDDAKYPRIFNPITQRLQISFITDCYLPIENGKDSYHRWVVYCGERNMNDPNILTNLSSISYISFFRVEVTRKISNRDVSYIYNLPITDYSAPNNPIKNYYVNSGGNIQDIDSYPGFMGTENDRKYYNDVINADKACWPYPLVRNHMYRLTVSFGDGDDINVQVIDGEKRVVNGIEFN